MPAAAQVLGWHAASGCFQPATVVHERGGDRWESVQVIGWKIYGGDSTCVDWRTGPPDRLWYGQRPNLAGELSGDDASGFRPVAAFADCGFSAPVLMATAAFSKPTPIQALCWPIMMAGRDCVGVANAGHARPNAPVTEGHAAGQLRRRLFGGGR